MGKSRKQWAGGKGDDSRISDHKGYRNNFDNISFEGFRKERNVDVSKKPIKEPKMIDPRKYLFIDDQRIPADAYLWDEEMTLKKASNVPCNGWDIVRSYDEFVNWIEREGIPDVVSFDNDLYDLGDPNVSVEDVTKQLTMEDWENFSIKTGAHCAMYLVDACRNRNEPVPEFYIHSANDAARPIIRNILNNAIIQV